MNLMTLFKNQYLNSKFAALLLVFSLAFSVKAQLSFPQGNTLNLNTTSNLLYLETRILFNTGIYTPEDYKWVKISDSIDSRWFVSACFNGQCQGLTQNGDFSNDLGLNDSTGFIAFHVETYGYDGVSVIKYKVYNKNNISDQADLTFNVHYTNTTRINSFIDELTNIKIVNPATDVVTIMGSDMKIGEVALFDLHGKRICNWESVLTMGDAVSLELPDGLEGLFILSLNINGNLVHKKIIIT